MLGASLRFGSGRDEDRFYCPPKARRNNYCQNQRNKGNGSGGGSGNGSFSPNTKAKVVANNLDDDDCRLGNRAGFEEISKSRTVSGSPVEEAGAIAPPRPSNLERFLQSTTPSVPAQYLSKTTMRSLRTCNVEYQPYFALADLWESFKEWSVYGAGVPLVLDENDCVVQYYVPYLSGIQLYGEHRRRSDNLRAGEESDGDYFRDSSSDGSSDCELERVIKCSGGQTLCLPCSASMLRMDGLPLMEKDAVLSEGFSSDDSEAENAKDHLLFEFFEWDAPYSRVPLSNKISELACHFPELKNLRSCDLLPASWMCVAWYPIYRIPTGPTLKDLDACFLTFHSLSTPLEGSNSNLGPVVSYPHGSDGVPEINLPIFGLASYKFKGSVWTPNGGCQRQLANSLQQAAGNWLRLLRVHHPDYQFFISNGAFRR